MRGHDDATAQRLHEAARQAWLVVTNDTEADDAWRRPDQLSLNNIRQVARFQDLCESFEAPPTYFVAYECANREEAVRELRPILDRGACEIGHHLHCWSAPPFDREEPAGIDGAWLQAYQFELPDELFAAKAHTLSEAIRQAYGVSPTSHRAGRWGWDRRTMAWLADNGFVADSSTIPLRSLVSNKGRAAGGPSFYSFPRRHWSMNGVLELPVTVDVPQAPLCRAAARYIRHEWPGTHAVARVFSHSRVGGGRRLSVDPRYPPGALEGMVARSLLDGVRVVNLALHSSELSLGDSPFSRTEQDLAAVWDNLARVLRYTRSLGVRGATVSDVARALRAEQSDHAAVAGLAPGAGQAGAKATSRV